MKGLDDPVTVSTTHLGYVRFLVLVNTYPFFTDPSEAYNNRGGGERVLQELEGILTFVTSEEFMVLPSEGNNRYHDVAVSFDEGSIRVCET